MAFASELSADVLSFGERQHIIVDNYATHKHLRVKRWFAIRTRFHVHFTPTYASWLDQVEIWFNRITYENGHTFSGVMLEV
jgi:transposase